MFDRLKSALGWSAPHYSELTTYLVALTCMVLFLSHPEFGQLYIDILTGGGTGGKAGGNFVLIGLFSGFGLVLSIAHVFVKREKSIIDKTFMAVFAMFANGLAGIAAGAEMLPSRWSLWALFPIWNILSGVMLLYQIGMVNFVFSDEDASPAEVIVGSAILLAVFAAATRSPQMTWAMTFSVCMAYSTIALSLMTWITKFFRARLFLKD